KCRVLQRTAVLKRPLHLDLHSLPTRRSSDLGQRDIERLDRRRRCSGYRKLASALLLGKLGEIFQRVARHPDHLRARRLELVDGRSEEHTSELQSRENLVCRLLLEKKE